MEKIIECVPNISEGRDNQIINACADVLKNIPGVTLLDVDPGKSTNRTVFTFVGNEKSVIEGAFRFAQKAYELIDMSKHSGEHPRMGAVDVVPFVPVANATMEDCIACAKRFGEMVGMELGVPIYLYEEASDNPNRKMLKQIRLGEYEGLKDKIHKPEWKPDYGPQEFVPRSGATASGARNFLIAYNVNILGTKQQAHRIALDIREQGRGKDSPGKFKAVKGIGWYVDEYDMAQVSMNLDDYKISPLHLVFEEIVRIAKILNLAVCGSELVGLIPLDAMLSAAEYYIKKENLFILEERQKIKLVTERLGLSSITPFVPEKRIIEYMIEKVESEPLALLSVRNFTELVGARTAAPGGGSVSALVASLGAALGTMMGWMTFGRKKFEELDQNMRLLIKPMHEKMKSLIPMIDADTDAFSDYMEAMKLPKNTNEEIEIRNLKMQEGIKKAIEVPFKVMVVADSCWEDMIELAKHGNLSSSSDLEVGAKCLETGIWGAYKNVKINLPMIDDENFKSEKLNHGAKLLDRAKSMVGTIEEILVERSKS
ncbi:MAG: glutamate formimidoyltransferase [Ignavibacteriaceae bacterium]|nr:glutamate formimidoyltransferase [Ignavibacteriaceae bacterium]